MNNFLVSIITATYNSEKTLERCILSVINQSYTNIEFIIIDGNSSDKTVDIIKKYQDRIKYWISEPDTGIYNAWNKGLHQATGEWIAFLGSDDYYLPDAIQSYVNYINTNSGKEFDFISSKISMIDSQNNIISTVGQAWNWKTFQRFMSTLHAGMFHNKELFKKHGNFNETYKISGDYELLLRLGCDLKAGFLDKITLHMYIGGISNENLNSFKEAFKAKIKTGGRNFFVAAIELILHIFSYKLKK